MAGNEKEIEVKTNIKAVLGSPEIPKIYANSFVAFRGNSDTGVVLQWNGQSVAILNLSFTLAKTLAEKLNEVIADFERATKTTILTTADIDASFTGGEDDDPTVQ